MRRPLLLASLSLLAVERPAIAKDDYIYGSMPNWERYTQLGETAIREQLALASTQQKPLLPDDWSIEWPNGFTKFVWFHKGRFPGYATCGILRAKTAVSGRQLINFGIVIDHDTVKKVDISKNAGNTIVNLVCAELVGSGRLPPARLMDGPQDLPVATMGVTVQSMAEGAYVVSAVTGGSGQRAGLAPGMVITRINGVALAGMGSAMAKVLGSDASRLELETVTGALFVIDRLQ